MRVKCAVCSCPLMAPIIFIVAILIISSVGTGPHHLSVPGSGQHHCVGTACLRPLAFWISGWLTLPGDEPLGGRRGQERLLLHLSLLSNHLARPAPQHQPGCVSMQGEQGGRLSPGGGLLSLGKQTHSTHICLEMERGFKYKHIAETEAEGRLPWACLDLAGRSRRQQLLKTPLTFPGACRLQPGLT